MTTLPHSNVATKQERLAGQELLDFIKGSASATKTEQCLRSGYIRESGSPAFTDWYVAILEARGIDSDTQPETDWYDSQSEQDQSLYDTIEEMCPEFEKLYGDQCTEFMDQLSDIGITTSEQFMDAYCYQLSSCHDESHFGEFVEYIVTEVNCQELPEFLCIDWMQSWYSNYRHDFSTIEFDGDTYFFHNHF